MRGSGAFGEVIVQDWQAAKLLKPSAIKPVLATLEQNLVIKTLGRLSQRDQQMLKETMTKIIARASPHENKIAPAQPIADLSTINPVLHKRVLLDIWEYAAGDHPHLGGLTT